MTRIAFKCPACAATHDRGFVDGVAVFRCLGCGYTGHGFHADREIDREIFADHAAGNALNRSLGIAEAPPCVDPLKGNAP